MSDISEESTTQEFPALLAFSKSSLRALRPLLIFTLFFHVLVAAIVLPAGLSLDYYPRQLEDILLVLLGGIVLSIVLSIGLLIVVRDLIHLKRGHTPPPLKSRFRRLGRVIAWTWIFALIYMAGQIAYVNLKPAIPLLNPATYDTQMEHFERAIFGGVLPSQWLLERSSRAALWLWDGVYYLFTHFLFVSLVIGLLCEGVRTAARLTLCLLIGLMLDGVITLAVPTLGPLFVHPDWFAGFQDLPSLRLARFLGYSVEQYAQGNLYALAGISAMPSYHVYAWICALFCWRPLPRWVFVAALLLCILNWISTVVLGWHYALDGLAGIALAILVWWSAGWLMPGAKGEKQEPGT